MEKSYNERLIALEIINDVLENGVFYNASFSKYIKKYNISSRDRGLVSALSYGTVERSIELDYIISAYSSKPVDKLKPYIRNILRMSVYQLMYMDQIPGSAAVNEAVKLAVKKGYGGLRGFVNGILRNIIRTKDEITYPDKDLYPVKHLSVVYSVPEWLAEHYLSEMTYEEAEKMLAYFLEEKDTTIRITGNGMTKNELMLQYDKSGIEYTTDTAFGYALRLTKSGDITALPGYNEGSFIVQNESSMIPSHIAWELIKDSEKEEINVLDVCASPGGKSLLLANLAAEKPEISLRIDARDVSEEKTDSINKNCERLGIDNIYTQVFDACVFDEESKNKYDVVIADVPCSGLGVLAGKCDIKHNASKTGMDELADIQKKIIATVSEYVKPGGYLIYSTCTLNKAENEENADAILGSPEYEKVDIKDMLPEKLKDYVTEKGYVKIIPGNIRADGFFVAVYRRK
ncbi:MAG: 16S rRNA (cytosine(967)-C(5))-methyltransferase RsmB [Lachnospiraceae bacterium]|nr:16S rRNA (cytosine(967)-C(5))-methyltransferase RsmB [Lachnospiraceae bacterium]